MGILDKVIRGIAGNIQYSLAVFILLIVIIGVLVQAAQKNGILG